MKPPSKGSECTPLCCRVKLAKVLTMDSECTHVHTVGLEIFTVLCFDVLRDYFAN